MKYFLVNCQHSGIEKSEIVRVPDDWTETEIENHFYEITYGYDFISASEITVINWPINSKGTKFILT